MVKEIWKDIAGYEDFYQISNHGRVRSLDRTVSIIRAGKLVSMLCRGKILKVGRTPTGYCFVSLCVDSVVKQEYVHRLVAGAFLEKPTRKVTLVMHRDDDPNNNHVKNLCWGTDADNMLDKVSKKRHTFGSKTNGSKLTEDDIPRIVKMLRAGKSVSEIAKKYNVTHGTINVIRHGRGWRSISDIEPGEFFKKEVK